MFAAAIRFPEYVQQLPVGYHLRIIVNLYRLAVASYIPIGRVFLSPAGISDAGPDDPVYTPETGVGSPESAHGKRGGFVAFCTIFIGYFYFRVNYHTIISFY